MKCKIFTTIVLFFILVLIIFFIFIDSDKTWVIQDIQFRARDGFSLDAYLVGPKNTRKKYPAVACFHQLWGNRDDFLKIFPYFAEAGIVVLAPDFPRQQPNYDSSRISDLRDAIDFLETRKFVDKNKLGVITASFSVETGMAAILNKPNVTANVMISGQIIREDSRKYLTLNSNLAIFTIASLYDGSNYLLMNECLKRSLNPFSRGMFIEDARNPFSIYAHGTFVFDEVPQSMRKIQIFFMDVFGIKSKPGYVMKTKIPVNTVNIESTDGLPVFATFLQPDVKHRQFPAVILYPPQFKNRRYYEALATRLKEKGIAVLAPNTKRTCRGQETLHLCDKEIHGAIQFLYGQSRVDRNRLAIVFPSFYYLIAKKMVENQEIPVKMVIFMETDEKNYDIDPKKINHQGYHFLYLDKPSLGKLKIFLLNKL